MIQFDDILLSCAACELERDRQRIKSTKEYQLYLKKFTRIKESYLIRKKGLILSGHFLDAANKGDASSQQTTDGDGGDSVESKAPPNSKKKSKKKATQGKSIGSSSSKQNRNSLNFIEAKRDELFTTIANLVGCIGCRVGVERFYKQLSRNSEIVSKINETIYPILIDSHENLILNGNLFLVDPFKLYSIFFLNNWYVFL